VCISAVNNLTADMLKKCILTVLKNLETIGFKILSLISDNGAVNRKAFQLLSTNNILQPFITHPYDPMRLLFLIFDVVHILKCIKNNWISKRLKQSCFQFPNFDTIFLENDNTGDISIDITQKLKLCVAQFKLLEMLYEKEKNSLVKYGHTLSYKVLYPTNIQKQNVNLTLKVFNENNIAALKLAMQDSPEVNETCHFLDIICRWWKIVNVKHAFEGQRFNDCYREPIRKNNKFQLCFLNKFLVWLEQWKTSVPSSQSLSTQTFQSIIHTTKAFLSLIPYLFETHKFDYILLSKFQNDVIEGRFGYYRQLSGANYYISYVQLLESERKIRFKNTLLLATKNKELSIKTLLTSDKRENFNPEINIDVFLPVHETFGEFSLDKLQNDKLPILTYIAGFAVRKELRLKHCETCIQWLQLQNKIVNVDTETIPYNLITELDRGKLILPSEHAIVAASIPLYVLEIIESKFYNEFLKFKNQLSVLHKISKIFLKQYFDEVILSAFLKDCETCLCDEIFLKKLEHVNLRVCKILLNNLVKIRNDNINIQNKRPGGKMSDSEKKIKKLKSL